MNQLLTKGTTLLIISVFLCFAQIKSNDIELTGGVSFQFEGNGSDEFTVSPGFTYYPSKNFGFGPLFSYTLSDNNRATNHYITAGIFFQPGFAINKQLYLGIPFGIGYIRKPSTSTGYTQRFYYNYSTLDSYSYTTNENGWVVPVGFMLKIALNEHVFLNVAAQYQFVNWGQSNISHFGYFPISFSYKF